MIKLKLDVTKIPKSRIFVGAKGKYLDLVLMDNRDGTDAYGNDGFIKIDVSKEAREAGEKGDIIGNWKHVGAKQAAPKPATPPPQRKHAPDPDLNADDIVPF